MHSEYKLPYLLYNIFQYKRLRHNITIYKKLGLKKFYFSPVSSKDFKLLKVKESLPFPSSGQLQQTSFYKKANIATQRSIDDFSENGYIILKNYLSVSMVDKINDEIDSLLKNNEVQQLDNKKIMFAWKKSATVKAIGKDAELTDFLSVLIGGVAVLFQSINFLQGSQQKMHSDSIHMTTYPLGGLLGLWIALEEIDLDNGPLFYYPGSHKLPYYLNSDYDNEGSFWKLGKQSYQAYEDNLAKEVVKRQISKEIFTAEKGDVLIWHANLLHGGMPHINPLKSRKSMVLHYYNTKAICYHEITQRPALIDLQ